VSPLPSLAECPVLILAGGLGTRLRPIVSDRPKGLAPIGDRPFLEIQISLLRDQGARQFVLCVGHRAEQVQNALGDGSRLGVHIDYSVETDRLLGTGGALRLAERFFQPRALVLNGDTYLAADYPRILECHDRGRRKSGVAATLTLARLEEPQRYGTVLLNDSEQFITGFREKDQTANGPGWLNAGAYVIERDLFSWIRPGVPSSIEREVFPDALAAGARIAAYPSPEPFFDIGTPSDFERFLILHAEWCRGPLGTSKSRRAG